LAGQVFEWEEEASALHAHPSPGRSCSFHPHALSAMARHLGFGQRRAEPAGRLGRSCRDPGMWARMAWVGG
jgi:hypothetical protein